jgi:hypothetical protein
MEHAMSTILGRRCGSAAYLSDAGITLVAGCILTVRNKSRLCCVLYIIMIKE